MMGARIDVDLTRRRALAATAMAWGGLVVEPGAALAESEGEISHSAEAIHQEPEFKASRKRVYEALTDTAQFDKVIEISGAKKVKALGTEPTQISTDAGGPFVLFGGHIVGRQIELVPEQRIVQAWRVVDWEPGAYSIARFELKEAGPEPESSSTTPAFRKDWVRTWRRGGGCTTGTRWRSFWRRCGSELWWSPRSPTAGDLGHPAFMRPLHSLEN
jgi:uncharacterized protein YndB with AHSA1/START domain